MFVFDYNSNEADGATKNIYTQMIASLEFNVNLTNDEDRLALQRDTQRRQDLAGIAAAATAYKSTNGKYPDLASGSYLPGISTSTWPSWQSTLGGALGKAIPTDPTNKFTGCSGAYNSTTCWAESTKQFSCPQGSSVYMYRTTSGGLDLYANMEYTGSGSFVNYDRTQNACSGTTSTCACFNYRLSQ
jgi:hypothetical protein